MSGDARPRVTRRAVLQGAAAVFAAGGSRRAHAQAVFGADEFLLIPLRIHLLRAAAAPDLHCRLALPDARRILGKINGVWKHAGVQFYEESVLAEEAAAQELYHSLGENRTEAHLQLVRPRASRSERMFHVYYIGEMRVNGICLDWSHELLFVKESARLHRVPGGIDEHVPRVSAHEIGHALGLMHRQAVTNLMASGTTGTSLNDTEIETARRTAAGLS
jgi:hypothetical protein